MATRQDPEVAELIAQPEAHSRQRRSVMDDSNRAATTEKIESVRHTLEIARAGPRWSPSARRTSGDNVDVHVKLRNDDTIDGMVITVIDRKGEAVFVNIVGNINADQLAKIADKFDIEPAPQEASHDRSWITTPRTRKPDATSRNPE